MICSIRILPTIYEFIHRDFALARPEGVLERPAESGRPTIKEIAHLALAPLGWVRLQSGDTFDHVQRRRVSCGIGTADLAVDADDFRKCLDEFVRLLENLPRLG